MDKDFEHFTQDFNAHSTLCYSLITSVDDPQLQPKDKTKLNVILEI